MASGSEMRVGDAEREATAAELREHYTSGRLTLDELNDRIDKAFAAKTRGDLDALMRDLPSVRPHGSWQAGQAGARPDGGSGGGSSGQGPGSAWSPGTGWGGGQGAWWATGAGQARRTVASIIYSGLLICALVVIGSLGVFGIGAGRPFGIALLVLAFGLLKRLVFGRRRTRGCGPRGRRRW